ncbi:aspartate aminotransferase family protein [Spiribacter halobius]|uniref:Aspartate aminotransferase family protein n=2 Tax=Sediminicurvatus halobius TaxID=2182432 RepID=A0A2U2N254_9GAMM|nr:aspartate aminotransferase family protein [Spiribacter halobius]
MPFTANRAFARDPLMVERAEGNYLITPEGQRVFDASAGLWCTGAGHNRPEIRDAVAAQLGTLDYAPAFQFGHPLAFRLAERLRSLAPDPLDYAFFCNSGSEAADTAIKMARAYWRMHGRASKTKVIGRARGYHGMNVGGTSVGGINANRKHYGALMDTDHLPHTLLPEAAFSRGQPETGAHLADELLRLIDLHDASNIAAVMVEPFAGSTGVLVPPVGYLERLREICSAHDILLIFDEVITGFGRVGEMFAAERFGVVPDLMTLAKQITNGALPLGAVMASREIHTAFMAQDLPEHAIEFPHGYTYSGHPVACAAAMASLDIIENDGLVARGRELAPVLEAQLHARRGAPHVTDIRNLGLAGAIQLAPRDGDATIRPREAALDLWHRGFYVRFGGDTLQFTPPYTSTREELEALGEAVGQALARLR